MDIAKQKDYFRQIFKQKRAQINDDLRHQLSQKIAKNFEVFFTKYQLPTENLNRNIAVASYIPTRFEATPIYIEEYLKIKNFKICYPKIDSQENLLEFYQTNNIKDFTPHKLYKNILEPTNNNINISPDIILVPLLAFDKSCNRLGMGKGFYDRTIFNLKLKNPKLITIGIAFNCQQSFQALPTADTDSRLDYIITDTIIFNQH